MPVSWRLLRWTSQGRGALGAAALSLGLLCAAQPAAAGGVEQALARLQAGDVAAAQDRLAELAEGGDAQAMYHLGAVQHTGLAGAVDMDAAVGWYRRAAEAGSAAAQLALGALYHKGKGVPQDQGLALEYMRQAARAGSTAAQYNLAMMHAAGLAHAQEYGAQEDLSRAYMWFSVVLRQLNVAEDRAAVEANLEFVREQMDAGELRRGEVLLQQYLADQGSNGQEES